MRGHYNSLFVFVVFVFEGQALASGRLEANFYGLSFVLGAYDLGYGLRGPGLGIGLESCMENFLSSPSHKKVIKINNIYNKKR